MVKDVGSLFQVFIERTSHNRYRFDIEETYRIFGIRPAGGVEGAAGGTCVSCAQGDGVRRGARPVYCDVQYSRQQARSCCAAMLYGRIGEVNHE